MSAYAEADRERFHAEVPKTAAVAGARADRRSPFTRDRARVLHSAALRRLAGKTQVVGPDEGDVPRTRLTHSLEVAQIGRGIAVDLGADGDLVDTAGLAHDIGHPPFGHNGEQALATVAGPCGGFEANAQTLRILTRLEPKVVTPDGRCFGLNLTRAVLDAATKYPWVLADAPKRKFGVYDDDVSVFEWIRADVVGTARPLESQIMDWADDVAYSVHDVEDGILSGRIALAALADRSELGTIAALAARHFSALGIAELEAAAGVLLRLPAVDTARHYDGSLAAQAGLKTLTSELVGRFAGAVVTATQARYGTGPLCRYDADLLVPEQVGAEVALLKAVALRFVMSDPQRLAMQARQRELLLELFEKLQAGAPGSLDPAFQAEWRAAPSDAARLRVVVDQIASLTDGQAIRWHGQSAAGTRTVLL